MKTLRIAALSLLLASPAIAKQVDIGEPPEWSWAKGIAMKVTKENLKDADSAKFQWRGEGWSRTKKAWVICGRVNARNSFGGYAGWQQFKMTYFQGVSTGFRFAPEGLGFNECNSEAGYHDDNDW